MHSAECVFVRVCVCLQTHSWANKTWLLSVGSVAVTAHETATLCNNSCVGLNLFAHFCEDKVQACIVRGELYVLEVREEQSYLCVCVCVFVSEAPWLKHLCEYRRWPLAQSVHVALTLNRRITLRCFLEIEEDQTRCIGCSFSLQ